MMNQLIGKVDGAGIWLTVSLLMFVLFFLLVGIYLLRANKGHISKMKNIPFED